MKDTDTILRLEKERSEGWQAAAAAADDTKDYFEMVEKVKRLDELWSATTVRALQAEQQRDAAHAALKHYGRHTLECAKALQHIPYQELVACTCGLAKALDAALAASAPQKADGK